MNKVYTAGMTSIEGVWCPLPQNPPVLIVRELKANLKKSDGDLSDPVAVTNSLSEQLQTAISQLETKQPEAAIGMSLLNEMCRIKPDVSCTGGLSLASVWRYS